MKRTILLGVLASLIGCAMPGPNQDPSSSASQEPNEPDPSSKVPAQPVPAMAGPTDLDVVRSQVEAYNARDIERLVACFDEKAKVRYFPEGKAVAKSHDDLRDVYGKLFEESPGLHCQVLTSLRQDDWIVIHQRITGIPQHELYHFVALYRVEAGRIQELWLIPEKAAAAPVEDA